MKIQGIKLIVLFLLLLAVTACVQTKTVPGYARAGDYIVVGLGGIVRNVGGSSKLKASDLNITITDQDNNAHTLQPQALFKSYPDYSAYMNTVNLQGNMVLPAIALEGMVAYDGGWFAVVPLIYPGPGHVPLPLAPGIAKVSVTSAKLTNTNNISEGDLAEIPIEILAGQSEQDVDFVKQFSGYVDTNKGFQISPVDALAAFEQGTFIVGAFYVVRYEGVDEWGWTGDTAGFVGAPVTVVPAHHSPHTQVSYSVVPDGPEIGHIYISVMNSYGFVSSQFLGDVPSALTLFPASRLVDLDVRLNYLWDYNAAQANAKFSLQQADSYFITPDGQRVPGLASEMIHLEEL
jgi:hypothetical protein